MLTQSLPQSEIEKTLIQDVIKVINCARFGDCASSGSAIRAQTDTQTDGTISVNSTAYAGGNK